MKNSKVGPQLPTQSQVAPGEGRPARRVGHDIRAKIGRQLRAMHDDVVNQGIPGRFAELLNRLDALGILPGAVSGASSLQVPPELPSAYCAGDQETTFSSLQPNTPETANIPRDAVRPREDYP
jgi:hypothetical protein